MELNHPCQTPRLNSGSHLSPEVGKRCCCLALAPVSYGTQPGRTALGVGSLKPHESKVVTQRLSEERPVSVSLEHHGEDSKHQAEIQGPEHNLTLPEVKWIISINPGQTADWLCWYFLEEKWLFCAYSKSEGHTVFIFATLQEEFVLLSQSQGTSLKFLNQGERFMQYQRLKGGETNPPSLQWSLSNALTPFLPDVLKLPGI